MSAAAHQARKVSTAGLSDPELWVEQYGDYLFRHAIFRLHDRTLAEDMVQETLLAAVEAQNRFIGLSNERTWLIGILKHKIIDHFRRTQNLVSIESEDGEDYFDAEGNWKSQYRVGALPQPLASLERKDLQLAIAECLEELPERLRRAFILREVDGLSSEEICSVLDVSVSNLWVMLHRARMKLQSLLSYKV